MTGASGFVGGHLVTYLQEQGYKVVGVDMNANATNISEMDFYSIDIRNQDTVRELLDRIRPKFIFHAAAQTSETAQSGSPWRGRQRQLASSRSSSHFFRGCPTEPRLNSLDRQINGTPILEPPVDPSRNGEPAKVGGLLGEPEFLKFVTTRRHSRDV